MIQESAEVKSKSKKVGTATYPKYENVAEAVEALGEADLLKILNQQIRTNAMNEVRQSTVPSKENMKNEALGLVTPEEFASVAGDIAAMKRLLAEKLKLVEAKYNAPSSEEDDEEESDE